MPPQDEVSDLISVLTFSDSFFNPQDKAFLNDSNARDELHISRFGAERFFRSRTATRRNLLVRSDHYCV
jgi:hypothetical protein